VALADCRFRLGRLEAAEAALTRVLEDRPDDPTVREKYARVLLAAGRPEEAAAHVDPEPATPAAAHIAFTNYLDSGYDAPAFAYLERQAARLLAGVDAGGEPASDLTGDPDLAE
jgi:predicted Zn-dependent protease